MTNKATNRQARQFVVFSIGVQLCALAIEDVVEIVRVQTITEVPGVNGFISGMMNLRGNIIPVIHLGKRYKQKLTPFQKKSRIIVIHDDDEEIGLIVDDVKMVTYVQEDHLDQPLDMFNALEKNCFKGFIKNNEQLIGILNLQNALYPEAYVR